MRFLQLLLLVFPFVLFGQQTEETKIFPPQIKAGGEDQVLTSVGGVPVWRNPVGQTEVQGLDDVLFWGSTTTKSFETGRHVIANGNLDVGSTTSGHWTLYNPLEYVTREVTTGVLWVKIPLHLQTAGDVMEIEVYQYNLPSIRIFCTFIEEGSFPAVDKAIMTYNRSVLPSTIAKQVSFGIFEGSKYVMIGTPTSQWDRLEAKVTYISGAFGTSQALDIFKAGLQMNLTSTYPAPVSIIKNTRVLSSESGIIPMNDEDIVLSGSNNVGIGAITPTAKLDVDGPIRMRATATGTANSYTGFTSSGVLTTALVPTISYNVTTGLVNLNASGGNSSFILRQEVLPNTLSTYLAGDIVRGPAGLYRTPSNTNNQAPSAPWVLLGQTGPPGAAATINIGTTTTLPAGSNATATSSGTAQNRIVSFGIPAGPTGATGATGPVGPAGPPGEDGGTNEYGRIPINTPPQRELTAIPGPPFSTTDYLMMPMMKEDPTTGILYMSGLRKPTHTNRTSSFILIESVDRGRTWTGLNGVGEFTEKQLSEFGNNILLNITKTGRFLLTYDGGPSSGAATFSRVRWSDDKGQTWSTLNMTTLEKPSGYESSFIVPYVLSEIAYGENGEILLPYYLYFNGGSSIAGVCGIASSSNNGETWNTNYSIAFDGRGSTIVGAGEPIISDFGDGVMFMVARSDFAPNPDGNYVPFLMTSTDYGRNWAGPNQTLSGTDIQAGSFASGWLYLEGPAQNMGGINYNIPLPHCLPIEIGGIRYLGIDYWKRQEGTEVNDLKFTILDPYLILNSGLSSAIVATTYQGVKIPYRVADFPDNNLTNKNGGNGNALNIGGELLISNYYQFPGSSISTQAYIHFLNQATLNHISKSYQKEANY